MVVDMGLSRVNNGTFKLLRINCSILIQVSESAIWSANTSWKFNLYIHPDACTKALSKVMHCNLWSRWTVALPVCNDACMN